MLETHIDGGRRGRGRGSRSRHNVSNGFVCKSDISTTSADMRDNMRH